MMIRETVRSVDIALMAGSTNLNYGIEQCRRKASFPRPLQRTKSANGAILWYKDEVAAWIKDNPIDGRYNNRFDNYSANLGRDERTHEFNKRICKTNSALVKGVCLKERPFMMCKQLSPHYAALADIDCKPIKLRDSGWY
jgi:hypothetical protein